MGSRINNKASSIKKVVVLVAFVITPITIVLLSLFAMMSSQDVEIENNDDMNIVYDYERSQNQEVIATASDEQIDSAASITPRDLKLVIKDPDANAGKVFKVWGTINQFDSATGNDTLRANIAAQRTEYWYTDGEDVILTGSSDRLSDFVEDDIFTATIETLSSQTYDNIMGGGTTSAVFYIHKIDLAN